VRPAPGVWHPTIWSWIGVITPTAMAFGGFRMLVRADGRHDRSAIVQTIVSVLLVSAGAFWLFTKHGHGP
jgi:hypothetical protein